MCECRCGCGDEHPRITQECLYEANYTHNCNTMAEEAGIYQCVWRPDQNGITKASQLIGPLRKGIELMKSDPARFTKHNLSNGWGSYETFVPWLQKYLEACEKYPDAEVTVSR